jgi:hypothetical protein
MNEKELIGKVYRRIDGELSSKESEELSRYLEGNPEASGIASQCEKTEALLSEAKSAGKEPDLSPEIMRRIDPGKYRRHQNTPRVFVLNDFWRRPALRYSLVFVAGIFAGLLILSVVGTDFQNRPIDNNQLKGTMTDTEPVTVWTTGDVVSFQGWQMKNTFRSRYTASVAEVYLDLSSLDQIETTIDFDNSDFTLMAVVSERVDANTIVSSSANQVRVQSSGDNKIAVKLTNLNDLQHEIIIKISQRGNQLYQKAIIINKQ